MRAQKRIATLDLLRSLAIVLMVIFHFIYDLKFFGYYETTIPDEQPWRAFRYLILTLFISCVGAGMVLAHKGQLNTRKFLLRLGQIAAGAAIISVTSLVMFPEQWIHFGVLHFIAVATLLTIPVLNSPQLAAAMGAGVIAAYNVGWLSHWWPFQYYANLIPAYSVDFVPLFPWIGVAWLGVALGHSQWLQSDPLAAIHHAKTYALPGRHSLIIYLVHQPLLFTLLWVAGLPL